VRKSESGAARLLSGLQLICYCQAVTGVWLHSLLTRSKSQPVYTYVTSSWMYSTICHCSVFVYTVPVSWL